jgi:hypothetical protein
MDALQPLIDAAAFWIAVDALLRITAHIFVGLAFVVLIVGSFVVCKRALRAAKDMD